jgi:hemoglobin-like flavoprotein
MHPQQIHLIRKSFAEVQRCQHVAALLFYQRLFSLDPTLRPMFRGDIEIQAKKLTEMLGVLVQLLDNPAHLETELRSMGVRHKDYGVQDAHYETVGRALLDMLAGVLDNQWTPEVRAAWTALYSAVEATMKSGANG